MTKVLYASTWRHEIWKGPKRYIAIVVYDDLDKFRDACSGLDRDPRMEWKEAVGGFFGIPLSEKQNPKTKNWERSGPKHFAGTMRLAGGWTTDEVILHEVMHAACHIYRLDVDYSVDVGSYCETNEENLAYITGDIGASVVKSLTDGGIWP